MVPALQTVRSRRSLFVLLLGYISITTISSMMFSFNLHSMALARPHLLSPSWVTLAPISLIHIWLKTTTFHLTRLTFHVYFFSYTKWDCQFLQCIFTADWESNHKSMVDEYRINFLTSWTTTYNTINVNLKLKMLMGSSSFIPISNISNV
jgi:hypothetical protein